MFRSIALLVFFILAPCHGAKASDLFPSGRPWMGGSDWERRLSAELGLSFDESITARFRFFEGPTLGLEMSLGRGLKWGGTNTRFEVRLPFRIELSEQMFFAPLMGWSLDEESRNFYEFGGEFRAGLGPFEIWAELANTFPPNNSGVGVLASLQLEGILNRSTQILSFLGLRVDLRKLGSDPSSETVSLVTGTRF